MSITKSPSRREPVTRVAGQSRALILAAHGESRVPDPNRALIEHSEALADRNPGLAVSCGAINGAPSFDDAVKAACAGGASEILVFPFFMSDGYFVSKKLPERIAASAGNVPCSILTPLGLDPGLADVMMTQALAAADEAGLPPDEARLLVVGHGSKSGRASAEATLRMSRTLEGMTRFSKVETAFLEEPPFVGSQLASEKLPVVVSGFFAGNGMHSAHDVPAAIEESGANAVYAGPVGTSPAVRDLIQNSIKRQAVEAH